MGAVKILSRPRVALIAAGFIINFENICITMTEAVTTEILFHY